MIPPSTPSLPSPPKGQASPSQSSPSSTVDPVEGFFSLPDATQRHVYSHMVGGNSESISGFFNLPMATRKKVYSELVAHRKIATKFASAKPAFTPLPKGREATAKDMAHVALHTLPYIGGFAGAAGVEALSGGLATPGILGFLAPAVGATAGAVVGGGAGEVAKATGERALHTADAPTSLRDAMGKVASSALTQGEIEAGGQLIKVIGAPLLRRLPLFQSMLSPETRAVRTINARYGLRLTPGEITKSPGLQTVENIPTFSLAGNMSARTAQAAGAKAASAAADSVLSDLGPRMTNRELGVKLLGESTGATPEELEGLYQKGHEAFNTQAGVLKSRVTALTKNVGAMIGPDSAIIKWAKDQIDNADLGLDMARAEKVRAAESILRKVPDSEAPSKLVNSSGKPIKLGEIPGATSHFISFPALEAIREDLGAYVPPSTDITPSLGGRAAKRAYSAQLKTETDVLKNSLSKDLSPQAKAAWEAYRDFYRTGISVYEDKFGMALLKMHPEEVVSAITEAKDATSRLRVLYRGLDDYAKFGGAGAEAEVKSAKNALRQSYLLSTLTSEDGIINADSLAKANMKLEKAGPEFNRELFNSPQSRVVLGNFKLLAKTLARRNVVGKNLARFSSIDALLALGGLLTGGNEVASLARVGTWETIGFAVSKVIYSRRATEIFLNQLEKMASTRPARLLPNAARIIGGVAAADSTPTDPDGSIQKAVNEAVRIGSVAKAKMEGVYSGKAAPATHLLPPPMALSGGGS